MKFKPRLSLLRSDEDARVSLSAPYLAEFKSQGNILYYLAAAHENSTTSKTFRLIEQCFQKFKIDLVILEGFKTARGVSPKDILESFLNGNEGDFFRGGESSFAAIAASQRGISFVGGEPEFVDIERHLKKCGYSSQDIEGFYFVQQVPQMRRDGSLARASVECYWKSDKDQFSFSDFKNWYRQRNNKEFDAQNIPAEETAPWFHGELFTQQISAQISTVREKHIVQTIADSMNQHEHVFVVYGAGHLAMQALILEDMLGKPVRECQGLE